MNETPISVTQLTSAIKGWLEDSGVFSRLLVKGEISNPKSYPKAVYFDLKDEGAIIPCVFFKSSNASFPCLSGDMALVKGRLSVYPRSGRYQLIANSVEPFGLGNSLLLREALKKKLEAEGLFDVARKRTITRFPRVIGIITADPSAAKEDLLLNIRRRDPLVDIVIFPSLVQGKDAPASLLKAMSLAFKMSLDTLIIARGGGSSEDLSAFDDEKVVRKAASSPFPTISAVGHEIDFTLLDFVCDKRVSTPTAAAEAATFDGLEVRQNIDEAGDRITAAATAKLNSWKERLLSLSSRPFFSNPSAIFSTLKEKSRQLSDRLLSSALSQIKIKKENLSGTLFSLSALSPTRVLERGYSVTLGSDGKGLRSVKGVKVGQSITTIFKDGKIDSIVGKKD